MVPRCSHGHVFGNLQLILWACQNSIVGSCRRLHLGFVPWILQQWVLGLLKNTFNPSAIRFVEGACALFSLPDDAYLACFGNDQGISIAVLYYPLFAGWGLKSFCVLHHRSSRM